MANPYVVIEKIIGAVWIGLLCLVLAFIFLGMPVIMLAQGRPVYEAFGVHLFLVTAAVVGIPLAGLCVWLESKWKKAKWAYERKSYEKTVIERTTTKEG